MKGQLNLFEPEFIKDIDCTVDTPVTRGNKDKPIYGTGKRIKPRVPGRRETKHMEEIYLEDTEEKEMTQENICKSCEYYESCGKPERYMKCMGYKERQQAAGKQKVDVQG